MKPTNAKSSEEQMMLMKDKTINTIYIIFGILAVPLAGVSIARVTVTEWKWIYSYHILIAALPLMVLLFLHRIPYIIKTYLALLILVSDVITGLVSFGILNNANVLIILVVVLAGLLLAKRYGYYTIIFSTLLFIMFTWLYSRGDLQYDFDIEQYVTKRSVWISIGLFIIGISLVLLEITTRLFQAQAKYSQQVEESETRLHTIIQQAADAVYVSDTRGRIIEVNQQACHQTGYSREELLQKTVMELDSNFPSLEKLTGLWSGILPEQSVKTEGNHVRKDGSTFPVEINISNIELDNEPHILGFARDISDRKKAETALRDSEEKFRRVIEASPVGMAISDPGGNVQKLNDKFTSLFGYTIEDISNIEEWFILVYPDQKKRREIRQKWFDSVNGYLQAKSKFKPFEASVRCKDGTYRFIEFGFEAIDDTYITSFTDLTERKIAEEQLIESEKKLKEQNEEYLAINEELTESYARITEINQELEAANEKAEESEERFRKLSNLTFEGIILHKQGNCLDVNLSFEKMFGYTREELIGKNIIRLIILPEYHDLTDSHVKEKYTKPYEVLAGRKDGTVFPVEIVEQNIIWNEEEIRAAAFRDITERRLAEKALMESNEKYKRLANATYEGIGYIYMGEIIETNNRIIEMYGYTEDEFRKLKLKNLVHPDDLPVVMEHIEKNDETPYEHRAIRKDGSVFHVEALGKTVEMDNKIMRLAILRDITERKDYEISLAASEQKFRNIFNSSSDGIVVTDFDQNILAANQMMLDFAGIDEKSIHSKKVHDFISGKYMPDIQKRLQKLKKGETISSYELEISPDEVHTIPFEITSKIIVFENKPAVMTIMRDISERRQMQQKIIQTIIHTEETERSRFAKELHDELGPLLSTMNIYTGILKDTKDKERFETAVNRIQNTVGDAILSIQQVSNSLSPHVLQNFGLPEAIRNFFSKLKDIKNIDFKFRSNLEKRLNQNIELALYRVIVELINNSVKYSGAGLIKIAIHLSNDILKVDYADNGKGFDVEKTLKSTRSMGLHNIFFRINSLSGKVDLTSQKGKGMRAIIKLNIT
ncbi:MAG: PAS domain S-box protein [Bacteroidales bacterium]|nr:PAS domain S-box protein [Bacteroidales bacterium]